MILPQSAIFESLLPCAILIPSLDRPHRLRAVVENIAAATPEPHKRLFMVSDPESAAILTELGEWFIDDSDEADRRYVTRMNALVRHIGDAGSVFFGSDDVTHHPGWLSAALRVMETGPSVVVVNDLRNPSGTQALVRATYLAQAVFDAPGDAFHRGYLHNFADTEMFATASKRGTLARALGSIVEHHHPVFGADGALPWDATYATAQSGWDHDAALYARRMEALA